MLNILSLPVSRAALPEIMRICFLVFPDYRRQYLPASAGKYSSFDLMFTLFKVSKHLSLFYKDTKHWKLLGISGCLWAAWWHSGYCCCLTVRSQVWSQILSMQSLHALPIFARATSFLRQSKSVQGGLIFESKLTLQLCECECVRPVVC